MGWKDEVGIVELVALCVWKDAVSVLELVALWVWCLIECACVD